MTGFLYETPLPVAPTKPVRQEEPDVVKRLRLGRARIARGWCQHSSFIGNVPGGEPIAFCAMGAVGYLQGFTYTGLEEYAAMREEVFACEMALSNALKEIERSALSIPLWNDKWCRTKEEVLGLYDRAIELELAKAAS